MTSPGETFRALHEERGAFVIPNPWDVGSARILAGMGFKALATTSGGMAYALGKRDGAVSRDEALDHCRDIVSATPLPVSADLEKGFGDTPEQMSDIITAAAETELAGCSIEDYTGNPDAPIYDQSLAVERIKAASEACRSLSADFVLTARCESLVWTKPVLDDVIGRLQAYEAAGADVLFAPGLDDFESIRTVVSAISKPVNVIMSTPGLPFGVKELSEIGVKRISIGSAFAQLAYGSLIAAAEEIATTGHFSFTKDAIDYEKLESFFA
ncbi:MAG: isocitrate lyase/PEP mutase family protein [Hyphomicrobiaceae bacterium]